MSTRCSYLPAPSGATVGKCGPFYVAAEGPSSSLISVVSTPSVERGKERYQSNPPAIPESRERRVNRHYLCVSPCLGATEPAGGWGDPAEVIGTSGSGSPAEGCPPVSRPVRPRSQAECFPVRVQTALLP